MLVIYVGNNIFIRSKSRRKSIKGAKEEGTGGDGHADWEGRKEAMPTHTLTP